MSLEDRFREHDGIPIDKYAAPNADYEMTTRDYVVRPSADAVSGAINIYLPPVSLAKGRIYSIIVRNADGVNTVTIQDLGDSECWKGDFTFNGKCDRGLFYSDGLAWWPMIEFGWPGFATTFPPGTTKPPTSAAPTTAAPTTAPA